MPALAPTTSTRELRQLLEPFTRTAGRARPHFGSTGSTWVAP